MKSVHSMVVAFDGESKCGKTTIINNVKTEADYQAGILEEYLDGRIDGFVPISREEPMARYLTSLTFNSVTPVSAGNVFRAAAYYALMIERGGRQKTEFNLGDVDKIRDLLKEDGIVDFLQNDPTIGKKVSPTGKLPGVQVLCGTLFCDTIQQTYHSGNGANLVIVDARDPIGHMRRNNLIGLNKDQVHPGSIMPIYIDTPTDVAAARMEGDYEHNFAEVSGRRQMDATRNELPVRRPNIMLEDINAWLRQFSDPKTRNKLALPYRLDNGESMTLGHVQYFAGQTAVAAQDHAFYLKQTKSMTQKQIKRAMNSYYAIA